MFDLDAFEERAAIAEYDGGMTRFAAETLAAQMQGMKRHEAINEIRQRNSEQARHHGSADDRNPADNLPGVQRDAEEQIGQMPECDVQGGRGGLEMLALPIRGRGVSR